MSITIAQLAAVYFHVYNRLVIIVKYRSALHAIILMGGAAASETLIAGYICTIGGGAPPKNSLERTMIQRKVSSANTVTYTASSVHFTVKTQHIS